MYLPEELLAELRLRARREKRPVAEIVREASAEYLAKRPPKKPRWIGVAEGPEDGLSGTELMDELREEWGRDLDAKQPRRPEPSNDADA